MITCLPYRHSTLQFPCVAAKVQGVRLPAEKMAHVRRALLTPCVRMKSLLPVLHRNRLLPVRVTPSISLAQISVSCETSVILPSPTNTSRALGRYFSVARTKTSWIIELSFVNSIPLKTASLLRRRYNSPLSVLIPMRFIATDRN